MVAPRHPSISSTSSTIVHEPVEHLPVASEKADPFEVTLDLDDPARPQNWSRVKRWYLTGVAGSLVLNATFASSAPSGILLDLIAEFGMARLVGVLTISLFVAGYCVGPLLWGPLSEQYGRRPIFLIAFGVYACFQIGGALARSTAQVLVFRFLGGTFAAAPLTNSGALISDLWDARTRGKALALFTLAPFAGPALGPTVAGYINVSGTSWRWVFWILSIFAGVCFLMIVFTVPETYVPVLLVHKAKRLRKETGDPRYFAPMEREKLGAAEHVERIVAKPFKVLFREPVLIAITLYMSFVYGCIYLLFEAFPIVFTVGHRFNAGASGLMFLPILIGGVIGVIGYLVIFDPRYAAAVEKYAPEPVPPEFRLEMALFAAPAFCVAFCWFGWTSFPSISFWAPMLAGGLMGFAIVWIFLPLFNYIIDTYLFIAASALAANTIVRSVFGAVFPLFANQMFEGLGPRWASSVLGFVALIMIPIPFVLIKFGPTLRARSKHAPS
ncbi:major facilitator superfamily domain-containing protein [Pterulicium gracile]|uniref:Major facilitator superfamily domain-containing protein n=1 Tax=Pterulicium gracile TaxID=1884261 RepID=A0A5C3QXP7_9AGAR|nr:major facilitator superfamily domain-containing protein [Pterula gracilis]